MKRSRHVALVMMGASALALTACEESQVDVGVFESVDQCMITPGMTKELCTESLAASQEQHAKVAPKYTSKGDCEADFGAGQCEDSPYQTQSGGSVFMPMMMGFMMGQMMAGRSQPLYRSSDDAKSYRTADNKTVASKTGMTKVPQSLTKTPSVKTSTMRRGGFGSRASSLGQTARMPTGSTRTGYRSFGG
ncbi:DUF1190 domain-containing protein [Magnetospira sp. QH-2]|uniref:DUF1190 domain-containing protein n=1 Tax=Magnetospira sp. (strain QH-2) TaxID=1288970 RepID=UPI0003E80FE1|nr:DUF1190 domain-containing protein [Magnetospira sp. QH-2]CCQ73393.1 Conserved protein of unknown functionl. putative lipoprotein [Magnetospira sp. QH-2]